MIHYKIEKEYGNYLSLNESSRNHVSNEYVTYVVEMEGNYEIGDKISSQDRVYTIIEKVTELKRNTIHFTYRLQLEATIQLPILYNEAMKGMSIEGTVISVEGDKLKLHLSIDEEQKEKATASFKVENGIIQTGIAYSKSYNATKESACSEPHMIGTIVEFCAHDVNDFIVGDLVKILSNVGD